MELHQLVRNAQRGDKEAFQEICTCFTGLVKKYAHQAHLRTITEEAEAQAWLAVVQAVKSYDGNSGVHFAGYVKSKVKFAIWNLFKKERRIWQEEQLEGGQEGEEVDFFDYLPDNADVPGEVEERLLSHELRSFIDTLPEKQRQVILRTVIGQEKLTNVAAAMGITTQAVYNLRQRGFARLKILCAGMYSSERG
ncbi:RNA polymerase sigma factor [Pelosinus propionicus]|uniref:RNA polymerase sigma factor, sigma-70 family n=1 Tax=Pelosinus propionicus DSM 13327 TaxID=1123291 RepID=A0A1I4NGI9_9FIRM|nr:sigma-70 family RNA polymerase sigma factor [Pelosinus propionicus]SFM14420.1 RNA polymerase sigma factor, sigma-70 family [Pelosinus propionicus DSM 13327]